MTKDWSAVPVASAYQFLAHDREGMKLVAVTDGGFCFFMGTDEQRANAEMQKSYFEEYGFFYNVDQQDDYERDDKIGAI